MAVRPKIHLVTGFSGEYEDARSWNVAAFSSKTEAEACRDACDAAFQRIRDRVDALRLADKWDWLNGKIPRSKFDSQMVNNYAHNLSYHVEAIPFKGESHAAGSRGRRAIKNRGRVDRR